MINKAELLRQLSRQANETDSEFTKYYNLAMERLTEEAQKGNRKAVWSDICYRPHAWVNGFPKAIYPDEFVDRLKNVLEEEGFTFKRKCEMNPLSNQITMYILW